MTKSPENDRSMKSPLEWLTRFFAEAPGSLKDHLNQEEVIRISVSSLTAGGGILGLFELVLRSSGTLFPAPADAALATAILTLILETRRRLSQGSESIPFSRSRNLAR